MYFSSTLRCNQLWIVAPLILPSLKLDILLKAVFKRIHWFFHLVSFSILSIFVRFRNQLMEFKSRSTYSAYYSPSTSESKLEVRWGQTVIDLLLRRYYPILFHFLPYFICSVLPHCQGKVDVSMSGTCSHRIHPGCKPFPNLLIPCCSFQLVWLYSLSIFASLTLYNCHLLEQVVIPS